MANDLLRTNQAGKETGIPEPNWWTARHLARAVSTSARLWFMATDRTGVIISLNSGAASIMKLGGQVQSTLTHESAAKLGVTIQSLERNAHQTNLVLGHCSEGSLLNVTYEVWSFGDTLVWLGWPQGEAPVAPAVNNAASPGSLGMEIDLDRIAPVVANAAASDDSLDPLTGAWSRAHLDEYVNSLSQQHVPFAIAVVDVDGLNKYNQRFGNEGGDNVLKHVVTVLRSGLRETDSVARLGGDECAVICPKASQVDALRLCLRLDQIVAATPIKLTDNELVPVTVSLGWACAPSDGDDLNSLLIAADLRLYRMKSTARK